MVSTIDGALYNGALHISNKLDVNTLIEDRNSQSEGISGHLERVTKLARDARINSGYCHQNDTSHRSVNP